MLPIRDDVGIHKEEVSMVEGFFLMIQGVYKRVFLQFVEILSKVVFGL